jgi:hypothetical protein
VTNALLQGLPSCCPSSTWQSQPASAPQVVSAAAAAADDDDDDDDDDADAAAAAAAAAAAHDDDDDDDDDPDPEVVNYSIGFFCIPFTPPPNPTTP